MAYQAELVIFDCDGVLVDSEMLATQVESVHLRTVGIDLTPEEVADRYVGLSTSTMTGLIFEEFGVEVGEDFFAEAGALIAAEFDRSLAPVPGMAHALASLELPRCVASSSDPTRISHSLDLTGLQSFFEPHRIFSATMVKRGKPAPDLFLHAAEQCGVHPDLCVVVEDSTPGVTAAVAAGMRVIGFTAGGHCGPKHADRLRAAGADAVISVASELALTF